MKFVTDGGIEIPFDNIKVTEVNANQRVIVSIDKKDAAETRETLDEVWQCLSEFFHPAKMILITGDLRIESVEDIGAVH